MNMQFNPSALNSQLVEVLSCDENKAELAIGQATFIVEHATHAEWFDVETPDGYSTGKRDVEALTNILKISVWCMDGLMIDVTSSFSSENEFEKQLMAHAIENEVERQQRTTAKNAEPDELDDILNYFDKYSFKHN